MSDLRKQKCFVIAALEGMKHCVYVPAGSPATDCGRVDHKLIGSEVVLMA